MASVVFHCCLGKTETPEHTSTHRALPPPRSLSGTSLQQLTRQDQDEPRETRQLLWQNRPSVKDLKPLVHTEARGAWLNQTSRVSSPPSAFKSVDRSKVLTPGYCPQAKAQAPLIWPRLPHALCPHLFMHCSFCLEHLLLTLSTWNLLTHPSRFSVIISCMKLCPNAQVEEATRDTAHTVTGLFYATL